jgi:hypothetical protein
MLHDPIAEQKIADRQRLRDAADYIEKHGWCQGSMSSPDGRVCLAGALWQIAAREDDNPVETFRRLNTYQRLAEHLLGKQSPIGFTIHNIMLWNDSFGRRKEEVVARLIGVADAL